MQRATLIICWIFVIAIGAFLRFDDLGKRPFHADEATGARITARRIESDGGRFDPKHYHGPVLHRLAAMICKEHGEMGWRELTKSTLRILPALAGTLLLFVPLFWRRRLGDVPSILAAAFLATSPLLVYYSRMFIHEMLLTLFGLMALATLTYYPRAILTGLLIGLMFATKESFAISIIAWTGAGILLALEQRKTWSLNQILVLWREYRAPAAITILTAALTALTIYTDGFAHPRAAIDAVRTFFVYETVGGHEKPLNWYIQLLLIPIKSGGLWWFGTPVAALAAMAYLSSFRKDVTGRLTIRFITYAALGHFMIYSLIAYKTPWLACLPWAHVCVLAGFAFVGFAQRRTPMKIVLLVLTIASLANQYQQARSATGRLASDERNPFAYVPTRRDTEDLEMWLKLLRTATPGSTLEPIAVIGKDYWPLPWYLRQFSQIGYWKTPISDLTKDPLVFAMPEETDAVSRMLEHTHTPLPRALRAGVPVTLFVRNDIWENWQKPNH